MSIFITILILLVLGLIGYYDFRFRAVPVYLFIAGFVMLTIVSIMDRGLELVREWFMINMLICGIQLGLTAVYFFVKYRSLKNFFKTIMGPGDLIFFPLLCVSFTPVNLVFFLNGTLIASLAIFGLLIYWRKEKISIPLAGILAISMGMVIIADGIMNKFNRFDDGMWLGFFSR